jgi:hypothetical protein
MFFGIRDPGWEKIRIRDPGYTAGRRTCSEHESGTEELREIKWDYYIVGTTA